MASVIEILVLQALAHQAQGEITPALAPLERALTLAEPEGYVRVFTNEGEPMTILILQNFHYALKTICGKMYILKLMTAFECTQK